MRRPGPCSSDFQRGEVETDGQNLYFDAWDGGLEAQTEPAA
ncbi:hypothetical protein [Pirellulimonas nuda]|nr:hypothetical protein [Pirellulimonas nuda]